LEEKIKMKELELQTLQMKDNDFELEQECQVKAEIHSFLEQEELKWKQRASNGQRRIG
jgi:hypothetical protein